MGREGKGKRECIGGWGGRRGKGEGGREFEKGSWGGRSEKGRGKGVGDR